MTTTYGEERTEKEVEIDAIVKERVERGIRKLQRKYGDEWVDKIDLPSLKLEHATYCVLGQVQGRYETGLGVLFPDLVVGSWHSYKADSPMTKLAADHGFVAPPEFWDTDDGTIPSYRQLNKVWRAKIRELQMRRLIEHKELQAKQKR